MAMKGNACSRASVHQVIYQVAFFCKVTSLVIFSFNQISSGVYSGILWALLGIDVILLGVVFLCQVCAPIRVMSRNILKPRVVAAILAFLVVFGIGESIMLALRAFGTDPVDHGIPKATFVFNITSALLVLSLIFLYLFWSVDDLGQAKDAVDAELGAVDRNHAKSLPSVSNKSLRPSVKEKSDRHKAPKERSARSHEVTGSSARSSSVRTGRSRSHSARR